MEEELKSVDGTYEAIRERLDDPEVDEGKKSCLFRSTFSGPAQQRLKIDAIVHGCPQWGKNFTPATWPDACSK